MRPKYVSFLSYIAVLISFVPSALRAADVSACNATLIRATYQSAQSRFLDWRLAEMIDESTYQQLKQGMGANATIYGVPMGAKYENFKENINTFRKITNVSLTTSEFQNILWTGLDPVAGQAYAKCIDAQVTTSNGLFLIPRQANENFITIVIRLRAPSSAANRLPVTWGGYRPTSVTLPREIARGDDYTVEIPRPRQTRTLVINGGGYTDSIEITPLSSRPTNSPAQACGGVENARGKYEIAGNPRTSSTGLGQGFRINVPECGNFTLTGNWSNYVFGPNNTGPIGPALPPVPQIVQVTKSLCIEPTPDLGPGGGAIRIHIDRGCGEAALAPSAQVFYRRWPTPPFIDPSVSNLADLLPAIEKRAR